MRVRDFWFELGYFTVQWASVLHSSWQWKNKAKSFFFFSCKHLYSFFASLHTDFKNLGPWRQPASIFVGSTYSPKQDVCRGNTAPHAFFFQNDFFFFKFIFFKLSWSCATLKVCLQHWVSSHSLDERLWGEMWSLADLSRELTAW